MFKVCIIGSGMIAEAAHIPAYRNFKDFTVSAICDNNLEKVKDAAKRNEIPAYYTDAEEMLLKEKPDVVSICVPNFLHKEFSILALKHDANVLCEKPLAFTEADAKEMFALAKQHNKILMACQSMRFTQDRLLAKKLIDENVIGDIYYGEFSRIRKRGLPRWGTFHIKNFSCGGAFVDLGVHMVDALVWLMGNPQLKSVCATTKVNHADEIGTLSETGARTGIVNNARKFDINEMDVEDFSSGSLLFENDLRINFTVAWNANMPESSSINLIGNKNGIYLPDCKLISAKEEKILTPTKDKFEGNAFPGHFHVIEDLLKVLKSEKEPIIKPEETINVAKIIEGIYTSATK